jgi:uncharacterized membrane protein YdjX (TVP38/TMEM64 family)
MTDQQPKLGSSTAFGLRIVALVFLLGLATVLLVTYGEPILNALADRETSLRALCDDNPVVSLVVAFLAYVAVTGLSLPGAAAMSVLYGWLFGFWKALLVVSFASTAGATVAFLLSRYLFGQAIQSRYGDRVAAFNAAIEREGAFYLFTLRLIPQVPFFVINVVMGLTNLPTRTFWWVSQLGMLPGTIVFVLAGSSVRSLREIQARGLSSLLDWKLVTALILLGVVPLAIKKLLAYARPAAAADAESPLPESNAPHRG